MSKKDDTKAYKELKATLTRTNIAVEWEEYKKTSNIYDGDL